MQRISSTPMNASRSFWPCATSPGWRPQALVLVILAVLGTLPFWLSDLDLWVAARFYQPLADDPWAQGQAPLWNLLYVGGPVLTTLLLLGSGLALIAGRYQPYWRKRRLAALFLLATLVLGPGLVVNVTFKDHWGRPRPHQIEELGGTREYLPPLMLGESGKGKSFPCGHASVGFAFAAFFLIWQRRRPCLAWLALALALSLGTLLGIARMVAGDHFLSDVIWSVVLTYGTALVLYYGVLQIPRREDREAQTLADDAEHSTSGRTLLLQTLLLALMVGIVLLTAPLKRSSLELIQRDEFVPEPHVLRIEADTLNVVLNWTEQADWRARLRLDARGFGLPWSRAAATLVHDGSMLIYRIEHQGVFSERDTRLKLTLVPAQWERIDVQLEQGDIRLLDRPEAALPELHLDSADGAVPSMSDRR